MAFFGYTDEFSNTPLQQAYSNLLTLNLPDADTTIELEWPFQNPNTLYPWSQGIIVQTNDSDTNAIQFPDATFTSVAQTIIIYNSGAQDINVTNFLAHDLATIVAGTTWFFWCSDNSTQSGIWTTFQLGAGASAVVAASLIDPTNDGNGHSNAGGLDSYGNYIKQNTLINNFVAGAAYNQASGDRGSLLVWTAGSGVYQCLPAATLGDGFIFAIHNAKGAGGEISVTPAGADTIDDVFVAGNPLLLGEGQSGYFVSDGVNKIYTIGLTQINATSTQEYPLDISAGGVFNVDPENSVKLIQKFIGTFGAGPDYPTITVQYPTIVDEFYFWNASTNPIQVRITGGGNNYTVNPGGTFIAFSDGTNLYNLPNFILFNDGSEALPSITFASDITTGTYKTPNTLNFSAGATNVLALNVADGVVSNFPGTFPSVNLTADGNAAAPQLLFSFVIGRIDGIYLENADNSLNFTLNSVQTLSVSPVHVNALVPITAINGTLAAPGVAFAAAPNTGLLYDANQVKVSNNGALSFSFGQAVNTSALPVNVISPTADGVSYLDTSVSIYSLMRAYG